MLDELLRVWDGSTLGVQHCYENIARRCMDWRRLEVRNNFPVGVSHSACRDRWWMNCYGYGSAVPSVCNIVPRTSRRDVSTGVGSHSVRILPRCRVRGFPAGVIFRQYPRCATLFREHLEEMYGLSFCHRSAERDAGWIVTGMGRQYPRCATLFREHLEEMYGLASVRSP